MLRETLHATDDVKTVDSDRRLGLRSCVLLLLLHGQEMKITLRIWRDELGKRQTVHLVDGLGSSPVKLRHFVSRRLGDETYIE